MKMKKLIVLMSLSAVLAGCIQISAQQKIDPVATEVWEPVPPVVTPGDNGNPPSDAIILFNGKDLSKWTSKDAKDAKWTVENGILTVVGGTGDIFTKQEFGDCQLHVEFREPEKVVGESQGRGNSGILVQSRYELQVLDCYNNRTYSNGQTGSIYKQYIPLVNACIKPGEWQTYDIIYSAPRFSENGRVAIPAYFTVLHNGILIQNHAEVWGPTEYIGMPKYKSHNLKEPLELQDHGNPVSYRNIWIREL
jgi:hypothetical protein